MRRERRGHSSRHSEQQRLQEERSANTRAMHAERKAQVRAMHALRNAKRGTSPRSREGHRKITGEQWINGLKTLVFMVGVVVSLCVCWTLAYYGTQWGYKQWGWALGPLLQQVINSVLGFFVFGGVVSMISPFIRKRQIMVLHAMLDALKRISRGDYRIQLEIPKGGSEEHFTQLVTSINDLAVDLEKLENMRQEFVSNVSHEIQSPLTSIGGFARILKNEELSREQQVHYAAIIEQESARLSKLSENMLRLASLDSDQHPFQPEPFRLDKQLQSLIVACEPQWLEKDLEMIVEVAPLTVEADRDLLCQVWVNLLHNAVKFTPDRGSISVRLEAADDRAVVYITDTGIGIPEEDLEHVFERFYKADKSRIRVGGGSGLGLSIIHKIVQMHQGSIQATSSPGEGTEMKVTLPLVHPAIPTST